MMEQAEGERSGMIQDVSGRLSKCYLIEMKLRWLPEREEERMTP